MLRIAAVSTLVSSLAALAAAQDPPPSPPPPTPESKPAEPAEPQPIADSNADAARILREKSAAFANKEPRVRAQALETFVLHRHESYVKPIAALLKDKNSDVARLAARALGNQPFPSSSEALLDFATQPRNFGAKPEVAAEAIRALGTAGLGKKGYARLRDIFDEVDPPLKGAIFQALGMQKEKKAFSFLVDHCDQPQPENPDSPSNPPAAYWKAKFEEWNQYKQHVRRGLKEMTGVALATKKQYVEWAAGEGKKLGFVYAAGS